MWKEYFVLNHLQLKTAFHLQPVFPNVWGTGTTMIIKITILFISTIPTIIIISATIWMNYYYSELEDVGNASVKQFSKKKKKKKTGNRSTSGFLRSSFSIGEDL